MSDTHVFARVCRACLRLCPDDVAMTALFDSDSQLVYTARALLTLSDVTIEQSDAFPHQICQSCLDRLNDAVTFKMTCESSHHYLQHIVRTGLRLAPAELFTDFKRSPFFNVKSLCARPEYVKLKVESDESNKQLIQCMEIKIESVKTSDSKNVNGNVSPATNVLLEDFSSNVQSESEVKKSFQHLKESHTARAKMNSSEPAIKKNRKDKLSAAELRLRDLIIKANVKNSKRKPISGNDDSLKSFATPKPFQFAFMERFGSLTSAPSGALISSRTVLLGEKTAEEEMKTNKADTDTLERLRENFQKLLALPVKHKKSEVAKSKKNDCDICGKTYSSSRALKAHSLRHSVSLVCEHCGQTFTAKSQLMFHCMSRHGHQRNYHCDYCGYQAMCRFMLVEHIRLHTGERPYTCETCGLTFRRKDILRQHSLRHYDKKFKCEECGKRFYQLGHLNEHARAAHAHAPRRRFRCTAPGCQVTYLKNTNMRRHLTNVHKIPREKQGALERSTETLPMQ